MKFLIEKNDAVTAITAASSAIQARSSVPILGNVLIEANGSDVSFSGTDFDMSATQIVKASVHEKGRITAPASIISATIKKMPPGALIEFQLVNDVLRVSAGKAKSEIVTLPADDYPSIVSDEFPSTVTLTGQDVFNMFSRVSFAMSDEETRYYLIGVHMFRMDGRFITEATDGHRLARYRGPDLHIDWPDIIVPRIAVSIICKMAASAEEIEISASETKVRFSANGASITSKVVDGKYPDANRIIPPPSESKYRFDAHEAREALGRVIPVIGNGKRGISIAFDGDGAEISGRSEFGRAQDGFPCDCSGKPYLVGMNCDYLNDILSGMGAGVVFMADGPENPILVRDATDDNLLIVQMPMRI